MRKATLEVYGDGRVDEVDQAEVAEADELNEVNKVYGASEIGGPRRRGQQP